MRTLLLSFFAVLPLFCQQGAPVRIVGDPPPDAVQHVYVVSGTSIVADCAARSTVTSGQRAITQVAISAVSKASAAVVTSTGHGFHASSLPKVTISGATGTGWTAINATFTATIIDADTFSIPINSTGFGTLGGTVVFTTTAPRLTVAEWAVLKFGYDGSGNPIWQGWLNGSTGYVSKCSEAATAGINAQ